LELNKIFVGTIENAFINRNLFRNKEDTWIFIK